MRVIITAGGTGGHIYPALAIIDKIKEHEPNSEFLYIGTHNRMEKDIVPARNIPFIGIEMYGFYRKKLYKNVKTITSLISSYNKCKKIIKDFKPDVVIGVGGYVTAPVLKAANKYGIKTMIHEQNSVPGATNLQLSKFVDKIMVSLKSSMNEFPKEKTVYTGNPCGELAKKVSPMKKEELGLDPKKKLVLFVMGSLGASKVNEELLRLFTLFKDKSYQILFITGKKDYDFIIKRKLPSTIKVVPYVENLPRIMKNTDIMVSRAGASTLSEISALELPTILIPSPYVTNNHQFKNAMDFVNSGAAILLEEKELKSDKLVREIDSLITDDNKLKRIRTNLKKLDVPDSAECIYKEIKKIVGKN